MEIEKKLVKRAIGGDRDALFHAFSWVRTDQGYDYWWDQYSGSKPIDVNALRKMLADAEDTPKTWGEMTDAERGALLLAHHEGKKIQNTNGSYKWEWQNASPVWEDDFAYRVKPEPKRETVEMQWSYEKGGKYGFAHPSNRSATHRITFDTIDGEPDCDSIRMERI